MKTMIARGIVTMRTQESAAAMGTTMSVRKPIAVLLSGSPAMAPTMERLGPPNSARAMSPATRLAHSRKAPLKTFQPLMSRSLLCSPLRLSLNWISPPTIPFPSISSGLRVS